MAIVAATFTKSSNAAKAAIRYISHRPDRDGEKVKRELFGSAGAMEKGQAYEMIDGAEKGTVFFRFVISPNQQAEDTAKDLQLQELTRQTMLALQEHLQKRVPFVAATHDDHTELRHAHLVACLTSRLGTEHFKTMREAATETALQQRQERDAMRQPQQQQQGGGQWAGQAAS